MVKTAVYPSSTGLFLNPQNKEKTKDVSYSLEQCPLAWTASNMETVLEYLSLKNPILKGRKKPYVTRYIFTRSAIHYSKCEIQKILLKTEDLLMIICCAK